MKDHYFILRMLRQAFEEGWSQAVAHEMHERWPGAKQLGSIDAAIAGPSGPRRSNLNSELVSDTGSEKKKFRINNIVALPS